MSAHAAEHQAKVPPELLIFGVNPHPVKKWGGLWERRLELTSSRNKWKHVRVIEQN